MTSHHCEETLFTPAACVDAPPRSSQPAAAASATFAAAASAASAASAAFAATAATAATAASATAAFAAASGVPSDASLGRRSPPARLAASRPSSKWLTEIQP